MLLGCGSSSPNVEKSSSSASQETTTTLGPRTAEQREADRVSAQTIVLQPADMPGWTPGVVAAASTSAAQLALDPTFATCVGIATATPSPDGPVSVAGNQFTDGAGRRIATEANVYVNPQAAAADFDIVKRKSVMSCLGGFISAEVSALQGGAPEGLKYGEPVVTDWFIGNVHTDVVGIRAVVGIQAGQVAGRVALDLVFALKGRTQLTLVFLTNAAAIPVETELQLTNLVIDRTPAA